MYYKHKALLLRYICLPLVECKQTFFKLLNPSSSKKFTLYVPDGNSLCSPVKLTYVASTCNRIKQNTIFKSIHRTVEN